MDILWPGSLILMIIIPLLIVAYIWILRRRRRYAVRFSSLSLVREAVQSSNRWRRHLPFAFFLLALACLILAFSRPVAIVTVPTDQTSIILTLDVSGSMRSTDIYPSRLAAAEAAALSFVQRQNSTTQIGIVAFSGFAEIVMPPTTNQEALQAAIESLTTGRRTAIGSGILKAIDVISEIDMAVAPSDRDSSSSSQSTPVPAGMYAPDIIVLLTDGVSNTGPLPLDAAQQAADRGVRIYAIGYGTENGSIPFDQNFFGPGQRGGGGGGGGDPQFRGRFRAGIDEETLKQIAAMTGGEYFYATSADELHKVFQSLPTYLISKHAALEISVFFATAGALLVLLAIGLALIWQPIL